MVDPTSNLGEDISPEEAPTCAACDRTLIEAPDHRVVTWVEDGIVQSRHFCDDACRADWTDE